MRHFRKANLARLRAYAETLMTSECEVMRPSPQVTDPDTGKVTPTAPFTAYKGVCKVQSSGGIGAEDTSLGATAVTAMHRVDFPAHTSGLQTNDIVKITKSEDPTLLGARFRLVSQQSRKTHATAMRWNVKEASVHDGNID